MAHAAALHGLTVPAASAPGGLAMLAGAMMLGGSMTVTTSTTITGGRCGAG